VSAPREAILARIRSIERAPQPAVARAYRRAGGLDPRSRLDRLAERLADYRADVESVDAAEVGATVEAVCERHAARKLAVPPGFPDEWRPAAVELVLDQGLTTRELDAVDGALTGCTLAIAETGTLVLAGGTLDGRRALTLVPDLHICVVQSSQVVELVPEGIAALEQLVVRSRRPLTFISGPSATSDIELSRVEGVHGPRRLAVLIIDEEKQP